MTDVFSPLCIRLTTEERSRMKTLLDEYDIDVKNVFSQQHKLSTKKNIIDMAKEFSIYFSRYSKTKEKGEKRVSKAWQLIPPNLGRLLQIVPNFETWR